MDARLNVFTTAELQLMADRLDRDPTAYTHCFFTCLCGEVAQRRITGSFVELAPQRFGDTTHCAIDMLSNRLWRTLHKVVIYPSTVLACGVPHTYDENIAIIGRYAADMLRDEINARNAMTTPVPIAELVTA